MSLIPFLHCGRLSSFNGIFGKNGGAYSLEINYIKFNNRYVYPACCTRVRHCHSIFRNLNHTGFLLSAFSFKMFKTESFDIVSQCQECFNFPEVSELIFRRNRSHRKRKFNKRFTIPDNYTVKSKFQTVD